MPRRRGVDEDGRLRRSRPLPVAGRTEFFNPSVGLLRLDTARGKGLRSGRVDCVADASRHAKRRLGAPGPECIRTNDHGDGLPVPADDDFFAGRDLVEDLRKGGPCSAH